MAEAKAAHAGLVERAAALVAEVARLEEAARELAERVDALTLERTQKTARRVELDQATAEALGHLDAAVASLDGLRADVRSAEEAAATLRARGRPPGRAGARGPVAPSTAFAPSATQFEVSQATATADLAHLEATAVETVQATLADVLAEVEQLERDGAAVPDTRALLGRRGRRRRRRGARSDQAPRSTSVAAEAPHAITAEEAIAGLRAKIDRLGPVNMMAIEQFDELETRHTFLTTQRKDLIDSIAATNEAIQRIDETSKVRFRDAFEAINRNFQETFSTLFGGGHAGITLIDETRPARKRHRHRRQPPGQAPAERAAAVGRREGADRHRADVRDLQVQAEPFCLLDEIDAPLDDANIGRFVEMLKGMLHHTQFILITHNRKTMEIADRLYGVTMEEPGVSKLISVRLN